MSPSIAPPANPPCRRHTLNLHNAHQSYNAHFYWVRHARLNPLTYKAFTYPSVSIQLSSSHPLLSGSQFLCIIHSNCCISRTSSPRYLFYPSQTAMHIPPPCGSYLHMAHRIAARVPRSSGHFSDHRHFIPRTDFICSYASLILRNFSVDCCFISSPIPASLSG